VRSMRRCRPCGILIAVALGLAGCSSVDGIGSSPPPASPAAGEATGSTGKPGSFTERVNSFFFGAPAESTPGAVVAAAPEPDTDCPTVDIRGGASTLSIGPPGGEANATNLRYQATIARTARECAVRSGTMTIKVGVQGRIILGPGGGPGQIDVPVRLALVREGIEPKTIWTKLYRVPVTIPPGQTNVPFVQVEENMTFPTPSAAELEAYVVYVGFDPEGLKAKPERSRPKRQS
jgi:hypothetical protein